MPSPSLLDLDALIAPIPGDSPAGGPVPFAIREKLEEFRKEIDPASFAANDPMRPAAFQKADWAGIAKLAEQALQQNSKDLLIAARLTEALTKLHGFAGLRDGVRLMRRMVVECWDRLNPVIESEDDLEVRSAPFFWLDEADRGARFPTAVRQVPMVTGEKGSFGWAQWKQSQSGAKGAPAAADIDKAIQATPRDHCQAVVDDLTESWKELDSLSKALNEKVGPAAPGFSGLRQALGECRSLAEQILERKGPAPAAAVEESAEPGSDGAAAAAPDKPGGFLNRQVSSRAQVYQQLAQAATMLQQIEPHSPIPYLINRAVELGTLSFPDLMKELVRDANVLNAMNRELGIKPPTP